MHATYRIRFDDIDYKDWAKTHNLSAKTDTSLKGILHLHVEGAKADIDNFSRELSWGPIHIHD